MDFATIISDNFVLVVVVACLVMGYLIKHTFDFVPNKYIPAILAVVGAALNAVVGGVSVDTIVFGAFMGLASTGLHQAFKNFVEKSE